MPVSGPRACGAPVRQSPLPEGVVRGETSHAKNVNITENEVEVSALMDSFGNCHCVKSNLLE